LTASDHALIADNLAEEAIFLPLVPSRNESEMIAALKGCNGVLVDLFVDMTRVVIRELSISLRYIGVCGSNLRRIDLDAAKEYLVVVKHVTGYCDGDTAQWIIANVLERYRLQPSGNASLVGKTLGIIGLGAVGTEVAKLGRALQMNVLYTARTTRNRDYLRCESLDDMLGQSDVIVITTPPHVQVLDSNNLENIQPHSLVVNVSVGLSIEPQAFQRWMEDHTCHNIVIMDAAAGGYYKGFAMTSMQSDDSNPSTRRLQISEQYAYSTPESKARLSQMIVKNVKDFLNEQEEECAQ
jgi:lactate dehydrogenase-like 2-hydroxyacid dehydrogenase